MQENLLKVKEDITSNTVEKIRFHSLDALRFFAFLKVYLIHVPIQGNFPIFDYLKGGGGLGVCFFFVLSGFLITYLLVFEKIQNGKIKIKKFLIRRSLRIWPLFYLMVIIMFLLPNYFKDYSGLHMMSGGYVLDWKYSFTFLENIKMLITDNVPNTTPICIFWSLCIEEHFYLLWLICLFFIPVKYVFRFLLFCIVFSWISRYLEPFILGNSFVNSNDLFTNIDFFAFGGILGYWVAKDYEKVSNFIKSIPYWIKYSIIFIVILIVIFYRIILPNNPDSILSLFRSSIFALLFTILIAMFIPKDSRIRINSKILNYLGTISFGLYIYHIIFIHCTFQYCIRNKILIDNWQTLSVIILITLGGSVIVSMISFHFFEKPFLLLRERLTKKTF